MLTHHIYDADAAQACRAAGMWAELVWLLLVKKEAIEVVFGCGADVFAERPADCERRALTR